MKQCGMRHLPPISSTWDIWTATTQRKSLFLCYKDVSHYVCSILFLFLSEIHLQQSVALQNHILQKKIWHFSRNPETCRQCDRLIAELSEVVVCKPLNMEQTQLFYLFLFIITQRAPQVCNQATGFIRCSGDISRLSSAVINDANFRKQQRELLMLGKPHTV